MARDRALLGSENLAAPSFVRGNMRGYINGWWAGLSPKGRTIISVVIALCVLVAFALALANAGAFGEVTNSLDKLLP